MATDLLQNKVAERPIIYAYSDTRYKGCLKVGYTTRDIDVRMKEQYPTITPSQSWKVELIRPAMRNDGSVFDEHAVHQVLRNSRINKIAGEWYQCDTATVERAIKAVQNDQTTLLSRTQTLAILCL